MGGRAVSGRTGKGAAPVRGGARLLAVLAVAAWALPGVGQDAAAGHEAAAAAKVVCLVPLGGHDRGLLDDAAAGVRALYGVDVRILPPRSMPRAAWYPRRGRHRAERILETLDTEPIDADCTWRVGFTSQDISTTKEDAPDFGIFGLAELGGRSAVVSTFRLKRGSQPPGRLRERTIKVVNHEVGHLLGLPHCPERSCLMEDARGTVKTVDRETGALCEACRDRVRRAHGLDVPERFEWSTPEVR